jgi:hypothetical protein
MMCWSPAQLAAFLALWRDLDLDAGTQSIRRSAGVVRTKGEDFTITDGTTKTDKPRLIDLDVATVAVLRAHRLERGGIALPLAKPTALVFGWIEGEHRHSEHTSRQLKSDLARCCAALGEGSPPECRLLSRPGACGVPELGRWP